METPGDEKDPASIILRRKHKMGVMRKVLSYQSVHRRIAELLHLMIGQWVECDLIEFVASSQRYQTDWRKRLRELRYLGLIIETKRERKGKRTISLYRLKNWVALPDNPTAAARKYELERAKHHKAANED